MDKLKRALGGKDDDEEQGIVAQVMLHSTYISFVLFFVNKVTAEYIQY